MRVCAPAFPRGGWRVCAHLFTLLCPQLTREQGIMCDTYAHCPSLKDLDSVQVR